MAKINKSAAELVGNTPLLEVTKYQESVGATDATILAKLEYFNPQEALKTELLFR